MKSLQPRRQVYKREVTLLSKGFSAPGAWPGGKITVYPWDSDVDAFLLGATKEGGNLLYQILGKVCDLKGAPVEQFVFSEINMILLLSRSIQFDGAIEYESVCTFCKTTDKESIRIPDELQPVGEKPVNYPGYDDLTLPECKDTVRIRPLLIKDHVKIEDRANVPGWDRFTERHLQIYLGIVAVGGGAPDSIEEVENWYQALSPADARFLEEQQVANTPRLDNRIPHKCKGCGKKFFHMLNFDQEFFRAGGGGKPVTPSEKDVRTGVDGGEGVSDRPAKA